VPHLDEFFPARSRRASLKRSSASLLRRTWRSCTSSRAGG
jgi:hypothetical protein